MNYLIIVDSPNIKRMKVVGRCYTSKQAIDMLDYYKQTYAGEDVKIAEVLQ